MHVSLSFEPERIARILAGLDAADWDEAIPDTEMNDVHPTHGSAIETLVARVVSPGNWRRQSSGHVPSNALRRAMPPCRTRTADSAIAGGGFHLFQAASRCRSIVGLRLRGAEQRNAVVIGHGGFLTLNLPLT